jgi:hypothetical protein
MRPDRTEPAVTTADAALLHDGAALFTTNPFEERWLAIQKRLLGPAYQEVGRVLALVGAPAPLPNLARVMELLRPMHAGVRARLKAHAPATAEELSAYVTVGLLLLSYGFEVELQEVADTGVTPSDLLARFQANHRAMFALPGVPLDVPPAKVVLETCYQARRAFHIIHTKLFGHRKGAFTGADRDAPGVLRWAPRRSGPSAARSSSPPSRRSSGLSSPLRQRLRANRPCASRERTTVDAALDIRTTGCWAMTTRELRARTRPGDLERCAPATDTTNRARMRAVDAREPRHTRDSPASADPPRQGGSGDRHSGLDGTPHRRPNDDRELVTLRQ